jgi:hypothetical protein
MIFSSYLPGASFISIPKSPNQPGAARIFQFKKFYPQQMAKNP